MIKTGQAPNIPWWRIQNMSDEEIRKHNESFMMIDRIEINPYSNEPESVGNVETTLKQLNKLAGADISVFEKEIWNAAIEAAIQVMDNDTDRNNLRSLKK